MIGRSHTLFGWLNYSTIVFIDQDRKDGVEGYLTEMHYVQRLKFYIMILGHFIEHDASLQRCLFKIHRKLSPQAPFHRCKGLFPWPNMTPHGRDGVGIERDIMSHQNLGLIRFSFLCRIAVHQPRRIKVPNKEENQEVTKRRSPIAVVLIGDQHLCLRHMLSC